MRPQTPDTRPAPHAAWRYLLPALLLTGAALAMRLQALDVFVSQDEFRWVCRSINFHHGLRTGDAAKTLQTGHPGVITMWVGAPAMDADPVDDWYAFCVDANLASSAAHHETSEEAPARLAALLFGARRGVAVVTALCVGGAFLLLARLFGLRLALLGGVLILLDPFFLGHSRVLHLDGIASGFLLLSLLSLAIALREDRPGYLALSGACAGLATLNKSPAMFAALLAALAIGGTGLLDRRPVGWFLRRGPTWLLPAVLTFVALWPSMWVQPLQTLSLVFGTASHYATNPHASDNFFWFSRRSDPGSAFYPVALAYRLTAWTTLGVVVGLPLAARRHAGRRTLWLLWAFVLGYALFMTAGMKKFDRYILPVLPVLQVIAAAGLWAVWDRLAALARRPWLTRYGPATLIVGLLGGGAAAILPHAPYYFTYYNPLIGRALAVEDVLLVGRGEGLDLAAAYLNGLPNAHRKEAVARSMSTFAPLFAGRTIGPSSYDPARTDYVVLYVNEIQRRQMPGLLERYYDVAEPLHVVRLHGVDYVWIYANRTHEAPMAWIEAHGDPATDAIVVNRPSLFEANYHGALRAFVLPDDQDQAQAMHTWRLAAQGAERIWLVDYGERRSDPWFECWLGHELRYHSDLLEERRFTDITLTLWRLRSDAFAEAAPMRQTVGARFGDELELEAYGLCAPDVAWTEGLRGILQWRALGAAPRDLSIVAYVVGADGRAWGQGDRWIVDAGQMSTANWPPGYRAMSEMVADLTPGLAPGAYDLKVEVYDRSTHERLPVLDASGAAADGPLSLGRVVIAPSRRAPEPEQMPIEPHEVWLTPELKLLGWSLPDSVYFGERLAVAMAWQAVDRVAADYALGLQLVDVEGRVLAARHTDVATAEHPTSAWLPGEVLWRYYDLAIPDDAMAVDASLVVTLLGEDGHVVRAPLVLAPLRIEGRYADLPATAHAQAARLGAAIEFLGFALHDSTVAAGRSVAVTLYWRAAAPVSEQYTAFVHLIGPDGALRGQQDSMPLGGRYPTDRWRVGEIIGDRYVIPVAEDAPPGRYRLGIGMYSLATVQSLPLVDAEGRRQRDDRLLLDVEITVVAPFAEDR